MNQYISFQEQNFIVEKRVGNLVMIRLSTGQKQWCKCKGGTVTELVNSPYLPWKVTFTFGSETHTMETMATSNKKAVSNAAAQFAKSIGYGTPTGIASIRAKISIVSVFPE